MIAIGSRAVLDLSLARSQSEFSWTRSWNIYSARCFKELLLRLLYVCATERTRRHLAYQSEHRGIKLLFVAHRSACSHQMSSNSVRRIYSYKRAACCLSNAHEWWERTLCRAICQNKQAEKQNAYVNELAHTNPQTSARIGFFFNVTHRHCLFAVRVTVKWYFCVVYDFNNGNIRFSLKFTYLFQFH